MAEHANLHMFYHDPNNPPSKHFDVSFFFETIDDFVDKFVDEVIDDAVDSLVDDFVDEFVDVFVDVLEKYMALISRTFCVFGFLDKFPNIFGSMFSSPIDLNLIIHYCSTIVHH